MENLFKDRLREIRKYKGITQKQIAEALKTYEANVSDWECGRKTPSMYTIIMLVKFLDVTAGQLLGLEDY